MNDGGKRTRGAQWGTAVWVTGVLATLVALPWAAADRLPDRLATHWGAGSGPDGSMPFWAAVAGPAVLWAALVGSLALTARRAGPVGRAWYGAALLSAGTLLGGVQASVVHANLDRSDWREAGAVGADTVLVLVAAVLAGLLGRLLTRRAGGTAGTTPGPAAVPAGPPLDLPAGERFAWLSRTVNPWLQLTAAVAGLAAAGVLAAALAGLLDPAWPVVLPLAVVALATLVCGSAQALVTPEGLEVTLGPLGRPVRRWPVEAIESARAEDRTPAQVGGWGYRLSGLGTTVMLRRGSCLVVRPRNGTEFAVSIDDAERGAALLNALVARDAATGAR